MRKSRGEKIMLLVAIFLVVGFLILMFATQERDPAYLPYKTTWAGKEGYYGQLHRSGNYTFYNSNMEPICTLPAEEASHLH